ncbi:MAG TPA: Mrp/NBP35 family ATP-binding protein [Terriglobia bacterium]|nr:Mrp/NBP35 family ATP-binding protein [Terriglobia bacterium]
MSKRIHPQDVMTALREVKDAATGRDVVSLGCLKGVEVGDGRVSVALELPEHASPASPAGEKILRAVHQAVQALGGGEVEIHLARPASAGEAAGERAAAEPATPPGSHAGAHAGAHPGGNSGGAADARPNLAPGVKTTIAVASGKGGVGKSTVAANLAVALGCAGHRVGLMDTDVYGPSIPMLVGAHTEPQVVEGKIEPPVEHGVKIISMGYFLPKDEAVIWRGPMLHKTVQQFLGDVRWGELDYLVIDLPPGTGDIQLSLCQTAALTGAVIVSTPQDLALTVASKAIAMFQKLNVPVLGIVENMSYYVCPDCGHRAEIFGHGGARTAAGRLGLPFLGEIPLDLDIRTRSDSGQPVALDAGTPPGKAFRAVAAALESELSRVQTVEEITIE